MKQGPFSIRDCPILLPDLGSEGGEIRFVNWLVPLKASLIPGERIAEVLTQGILFQLEAEVAGVLIAQAVRPDDLLQAGDKLGMIQGEADADEESVKP